MGSPGVTDGCDDGRDVDGSCVGLGVGAGVHVTSKLAVSERPASSVHVIVSSCSAMCAPLGTTSISSPSFAVILESTITPSAANSSFTVSHSSPRYSQVTRQSSFDTHVHESPTLRIRKNEAVGASVGAGVGFGAGRVVDGSCVG